jgi:regulator of replication initiation timing
MSRTITRSTELEPIDRLEEKVRALVEMIGRLKADQSRVSDENTRLARELEAAKARIADSEEGLAEMAALRTERETIRGRVTDMLDQLEGLSL